MISKNNAAWVLPLVAALAEGKIIQVRPYGGHPWMDSNRELTFRGWKENYRIKPEPEPKVLVVTELERTDFEPIGLIKKGKRYFCVEEKEKHKRWNDSDNRYWKFVREWEITVPEEN
jgi:hypothetical protein